MLLTIVVLLLVLSLIGVLPVYSYSNQWGYAPSGGIGVLLVIILIIFLLGGV